MVSLAVMVIGQLALVVMSIFRLSLNSLQHCKTDIYAEQNTTERIRQQHSAIIDGRAAYVVSVVKSVDVGGSGSV